jgi:hypothetical protein
MSIWIRQVHEAWGPPDATGYPVSVLLNRGTVARIDMTPKDGLLPSCLLVLLAFALQGSQPLPLSANDEAKAPLPR